MTLKMKLSIVLRHFPEYSHSPWSNRKHKYIETPRLRPLWQNKDGTWVWARSKHILWVEFPWRVKFAQLQVCCPRLFCMLVSFSVTVPKYNKLLKRRKGFNVQCRAIWNCHNEFPLVQRIYIVTKSGVGGRGRGAVFWLTVSAISVYGHLTSLLLGLW
jgi:hypothetical protein